MIFFKKIRWQNFLSYGNVFTEVDLIKNKTTLIIGKNGAGKSTLIDAISFVLYGKAYRNINKPNIINSVTNKNCLVETEFTIGQRNYLIRRGLKPAVFDIYCDDVLIKQPADLKEYQDILEKQILKLNYKSFTQIVILGSAGYIPFMQLPAAHRRDIIEDLLDIQIFSQMNIILKERIQDNKQKVSDIEYEIKLLEQKVALHNKHLNQLKQNTEELISDREEKIKLAEDKILEYRKEIKKLTEDNEKLLTLVIDEDKLLKKKTKLYSLGSQIETKIKSTKKEIDFYTNNDSCPTCTQTFEETLKESILEKKSNQFNDLVMGYDRYQDDYKEVSDQLSVILKKNKEIQNNNQNLLSYNGKISFNEENIKAYKSEIDKFRQTTKQYDVDNTVLIETQNELDKKESERIDELTQRQLYEVATILLKDSGIKTKIIKQYIPIMNKLINKYLSQMDFFVQFELNENFEEKIKSRFRDEFSYESFSQGQKLRIDLAILFSWRTISKMRNSAAINILIFDEILDGSLDTTGIDEFIKILGDLTQDNNIFVISHKQDQFLEKFDHVIKFEMNKNFSRMVK